MYYKVLFKVFDFTGLLVDFFVLEYFSNNFLRKLGLGGCKGVEVKCSKIKLKEEV